MALAYTPPSRDAWFSVGLASSYLNVTASDDVNLAEHRSCSKDGIAKPGCKVFLVPEADGSKAVVELSHDPKDQLDASLRKGEQVLVFQYNDKFHAIDNVSNISLEQACATIASGLMAVEMPSLIVSSF
jgi:hypothetical protein